MMKKAVSLFLAALLSLTALAAAIPALPQRADAAIDFSCGPQVTWDLDAQTGVLTLSGTGVTYDYDYGFSVPWYNYERSVNSVVVEEGITRLGDRIFGSFWNSVTIALPASLTSIGDNVFDDGVQAFTIPAENRLAHFGDYSSFQKTRWFQNQPDGPVYLGNVFVGYHGTLTAADTLTLRAGTVAITPDALSGQPALTHLEVPESLAFVGRDALKGTAWLAAQPVGPVYLGKALYAYQGNVTVPDSELTIREGTRSVTCGAFWNHGLVSVHFPESMEEIGNRAFFNAGLKAATFAPGCRLQRIGDYAFYLCQLASMDLPEGLQRIGTMAIGPYEPKELYIPASVTEIGALYPNKNSNGGARMIYHVAPENPCYSADDSGILYNKDQTTLIRGAQNNTRLLAIPTTVTTVAEGAFRYLSANKVIQLPDGLQKVEDLAFSHMAYDNVWSGEMTVDFGASTPEIGADVFLGDRYLGHVIVRSMTLTFPENALQDCTQVTIHCFDGSAMQAYAEAHAIPYVLLDASPAQAETAALTAALAEAQAIDRALYTEDSLAALDAAVAAADPTAAGLTQAQADAWTAAVQNALRSLRYRPADYQAVDDALRDANAVDRRFYTDDSLAALDAALAAIPSSADLTNQAAVTAAAQAIRAALDGLQLKAADYTAVEALQAEAAGMDRLLYSQATLTVLDQSIAAVTPGLDVTQQAVVDGFAATIRQALDGLAYADVTLRNDPQGVLVSGTAKEIYPTTALTVDRLDPSRLEGANFAVGGYIKSVQYFDIRLIRGGAVVQPNGRVAVKIRIPAGVAPEKCRVYHVTADPVDPLVRFASALDGNYIVFDTDHFSEFAVIEVETVLTSIRITTPPAKTVYALGELVDPAGMVVTAAFSDGTEKPVTDYRCALDTTLLGTQPLTVYYTFNGRTCEATTPVAVVAPAGGTQIQLRQPSTLKLIYGDILILHADANLPVGASIVWKCADRSVKLTPAADGHSCAVKATGSGTATVTAAIVDRAGQPVTRTDGTAAADAVQLTADGSFFARLRSFFRDLFRFNRVIDE